MSIIDPYAPCYTFQYEKIIPPNYKYVKDKDNRIHRICLTEYVRRHNASSREEPYVYARYKVQRQWYPETKLQRIMNILFEREDVVKTDWLEIKSEFYSSDFYSEFSPSGLVGMDYIHDTYEDAESGKPCYIFRDYNLKEG